MLRHRAWMLCAAMVAGIAAVAAQPDRPPQPPDDGPRFEPYESVIRGDWRWIGRFDPDGNFIRNPRSGPRNPHVFVGGPGGNDLSVNDVVRENRSVYEHRSGR